MTKKNEIFADMESAMKEKIQVSLDDMCEALAMAMHVMERAHREMYDIGDKEVKNLHEVLAQFGAVTCTILKKKYDGGKKHENHAV
jgi:hypothetical protein